MDSDAKTSLLARLSSAASSEAQPEVSAPQPALPANDVREDKPVLPRVKPSQKLNVVAREVLLNVTGMRPGGTNGDRQLFTEQATSVLVQENGGVIQLTEEVARGQLLLLTNVESKQQVVAQVKRTYQPMNRCVDLVFAEDAPRFWGMKFSAATALLPKDAKLTEAAALISSGGTAEEPPVVMDPPPAPTPEEVQALKRELASVAQGTPGQAVTGESAMPSIAPKEVAPEPVSYQSTAAEPTQIWADISAEVPTQTPAQIPAQTPTKTSTPSAVYAMPLPKPKRAFVARGKFTPGAGLRLTLLTTALVVTIVGAFTFKNWNPWKASARKPSTGVFALTAKFARPLSAAGARAAMEPSDVASSASATSPVMPSRAPQSASEPSTSNRPLAQSPLEKNVEKTIERTAENTLQKTPSSVRLVGKREVIRHAATPSPAPLADSAADSVIVPPKLIKSVKAVASLNSLIDFETGNVLIDAVVDTDGQVHFITVISGPPSLRAPAVEAVKQYQYEPATRNGQPVPQHVHITVRFRFEE